MLGPTSIPGAMFPESWWNLGLDWTWKFRETGKSGKVPIVMSFSFFFFSFFLN